MYATFESQLAAPSLEHEQSWLQFSPNLNGSHSFSQLSPWNPWGHMQWPVNVNFQFTKHQIKLMSKTRCSITSPTWTISRFTGMLAISTIESCCNMNKYMSLLEIGNQTIWTFAKAFSCYWITHASIAFTLVNTVRAICSFQAWNMTEFT